MNLLMLLASGFADSSFVRLFTDMNPWCVGLFVLGIIFCIIEVFMPGFGFFGVSGMVLIVVGMILRLILGGDVWMLVYMLLIFAGILTLLFFVFAKILKKAKHSPNSIFYIGTSVPEDRTEGTKDYSAFVEKAGVTQTTLHPVGKAIFDGEVLDVVARDGFIEKGKKVRIIAVQGQKIEVTEIEEE